MRQSAPALPKDIGGSYTVLDMVDRAFRIYRENFLAFLSITALVMVPFAVIQLPITLYQQANVTYDAFGNQIFTAIDGISTLVLFIGSALQAILVQAVIVYMASESHNGASSTLGRALEAVRSRLFPLTGAYLILGLAFLVLIVGSAITIYCLVGFLGMAFTFYIYLAIQYFLVPVMILEPINVNLGLNRAWNFGKRRFWRATSLYVLTTIIAVTVYLAFFGVAEFAYQPLLAAGQNDLVTILQSVVTTVLTIFITPLSPIAFTIMYYDTRVRLEGLDIAYYVSGSQHQRPADLPATKPTGRFLRGIDLANILALLLPGAVLIFIGMAFAVAGMGV